jgi:DNA-binding MarR family transcriptional regulator
MQHSEADFTILVEMDDHVSETADDAMNRLFDLAVVLGDLMNRRLAEHGLTPARAELVWLLHRDGPRTQRELSRALTCTPRNVTGLVDALEATGFVLRSPHPTDRRATVVSLTREGATLARGWHRDRDDGTADLLGETSPADLATFVTVLDRILGNLRTGQEAAEAREPGSPVRRRRDR